MRTFLTVAGLASALCLLAGCPGDDTVPDAVYKFELAAEPVTLGADTALARLASITATSTDSLLENIPDAAKRWERFRSPVIDLIRQGLKQLEAPERVEVCKHPSGRERYGALAAAVSKLARGLGASREPYLEFGYALEGAEIIDAGLGAPRSKLEEERDKKLAEFEAQTDALLASVCRVRVEQARLFLSAGETAKGFDAASDARGIINDFKLVGDSVDKIAADAAKLAAGAPAKPGAGDGDGATNQG